MIEDKENIPKNIGYSNETVHVLAEGIKSKRISNADILTMSIQLSSKKQKKTESYVS